jgi:hypothetical protein
MTIVISAASQLHCNAYVSTKLIKRTHVSIARQILIKSGTRVYTESRQANVIITFPSITTFTLHEAGIQFYQFSQNS